MSALAYRLPDGLAADIDAFDADVRRFLAGELDSAVFKDRRVPRGIYEQRRDGTYMLRVRLPGGLLAATQARALAGIGREFGGGTLHVTTRQDIQLHDLRIADTPAVMRRLLAAGLTCKGGGGNTVRNVTACPHAGICPRERFDVTPHALAVTEHLIAQAGSYSLPRKFKIAFSGCAADCALAEVNDLGFFAEVRDGQPGFAVCAGGGMGAESRVADRLVEWLPAGECVRAAEAVRRLFDRFGDRTNRRRARLRFAVARLGPEAFAQEFFREFAAVTADGAPVCAAPPAPAPAGAACLPPEQALVGRAGLDVLPQRQPGLVAVPLRLPLGQVAWQDLEALAAIAERFSGERALRAANQKLLLRSVREPDLPALRAALAALRQDVTTPSTLDAFVACTGAATCRLGFCLSQDAARACAEALARAGIAPEGLRGLDIRLNGCPNACGHAPIGTVGLAGCFVRAGGRPAPAYRVLLGARRGQGRTRFGEDAGLVPAGSLPAFLLDLVRAFRARRLEGEAFSDCYDRLRPAFFRALVARHAVAEDVAGEGPAPAAAGECRP
jgi:sulfite reductase (ferredoxin)